MSNQKHLRTMFHNHNTRPTSLSSKMGVLAAIMTAGLIPASVQANELFDGRAEVHFLAMQNFQAIQAKDGAFRPADEEQSTGFGRLRVNLQLKFKITDYITADIDIAEEPNDFGNNGDRDFSFHQDFAGIEFELFGLSGACLLYTSPSPRDLSTSRMPSSA